MPDWITSFLVGVLMMLGLDLIALVIYSTITRKWKRDLNNGINEIRRHQAMVSALSERQGKSWR